MIGPLLVTEMTTGTFATIMNVLKKESVVTETQLKIPHIVAEPDSKS